MYEIAVIKRNIRTHNWNSYLRENVI